MLSVSLNKTFPSFLRLVVSIHGCLLPVGLMFQVLWPFLLELIVPEQYTEAAGAVCRSVAYLSNKKRKENADDYDIDFELQGICYLNQVKTSLLQNKLHDFSILLNNVFC